MSGSGFTGGSAYIKFGTTVLSQDYRRFNPSERADSVDQSAGADTHRAVVVTLTTGRIQAELVAQTGGSAIWDAVAIGTSGTLEWGDEGTASTKPKHTCTAVVLSREKTLVYDQLEVYNVEFNMQTKPSDTSY